MGLAHQKKQVVDERLSAAQSKLMADSAVSLN
jgi:hypothetical protein